MQLRRTVFILCALLSFSSKGQYAIEGFSLSDSSTTWFDRKLGVQGLEIFTGVYNSLEGRPALERVTWGSGVWTVGDLHYRGGHYPEVYLLYDLENDVLLTKNHVNTAYLDQPINLNQEQIDWFQLGNERFVPLPSLSELADGFYLELFKTTYFGMYAKRRVVVELGVNEVRLKSNDSFYLIYNEKVNRVHKPSSFYKLFPELRSKLKPVFKSLRVRKFEKASVQQLKQLAHRCALIIPRP